MRRLCRSVTAMALLAALWVGCGSTADDRLLLRFINFDNTGITQADSVRQNSADVDVVQEFCAVSMTGTQTVEPFTQTAINAVFRNDQGSDILLQGYTVDVGPGSGVGVFQGQLSANIIGGRCSNQMDKECALDADCVTLNLPVGTVATCTHAETTVSGILLFDFDLKAHVIPGTYNVAITFFGSDANRSFEVSTTYTVRFDDFDNCKTSGGA